MNIHLLAEGQLEIPIGEKLIQHCGHTLATKRCLGGCTPVKAKAWKFRSLAQNGEAVLVLTDFMDARCPCVPKALAEYGANKVPARTFLYRFAVQELESWLLADANNMAEFLQIAPEKIPQNPETLPDPKRELVNLARKSRNRRIREALVPSGSGRVGQCYEPKMEEFVRKYWSIESAQQRAPSLARCVRRLCAL